MRSIGGLETRIVEVSLRHNLVANGQRAERGLDGTAAAEEVANSADLGRRHGQVLGVVAIKPARTAPASPRRLSLLCRGR